MDNWTDATDKTTAEVLLEALDAKDLAFMETLAGCALDKSALWALCEMAALSAESPRAIVEYALYDLAVKKGIATPLEQGFEPTMREDAITFGEDS